jgi:hypothetical protein
MNFESSAQQYRLSFTTGGLFWKESLAVMESYRTLGDWNAVRAEVISKDLLKLRTQAARVRVSREVIGRLSELNVEELELLEEGTIQEQQWLLWLAACRHFEMIREFAVEVLRENYLSLRGMVSLKDFDAFFFRKSQFNDEMDALQETTRRKLRQNLFRMMREADLVTEGGLITPPILTHCFVRTIAKSSIKELEVFPASEADIQKWAS